MLLDPVARSSSSALFASAACAPRALFPGQHGGDLPLLLHRVFRLARVDGHEVVSSLAVDAAEQNAPLLQADHSVKVAEELGGRLVDGRAYDAVLVASNLPQRLDQLQGVVAVQPARGLVQKQHHRSGNQLDAGTHPFLLAPADAFDQIITDNNVLHFTQPQQIQ